jgi:hypothetical protein
MREVILRTAIGQPRNRWKVLGGDMHLAQPAGGKPTMLFDRETYDFASGAINML